MDCVYYDDVYNAAYCSADCARECKVEDPQEVDRADLRKMWFNERTYGCACCGVELLPLQVND